MGWAFNAAWRTKNLALLDFAWGETNRFDSAKSARTPRSQKYFENFLHW
jgi:hypothetical protein